MAKRKNSALHIPQFNSGIHNDCQLYLGALLCSCSLCACMNTCFSVYIFLLTGPSAAPTGFAVLSVSSSSITLTWIDLLCFDQNGPLLGYVIEYTPDGGMASTTLLTGDNQLTGLAACTNYTMRIAAQNDAGTGEFSSPLCVITKETGEE